MKTNVAVFFGGVSVEHDISVITGLQALKVLDSSKYKIMPIYITKQGYWRLYDKIESMEDLKTRRPKKVFLVSGDNNLYEKIGLFNMRLGQVHCALLCMHGASGEDGVLQGVLSASGIPYTSADIKGCAVTMDKHFCKMLLKENGFNVVEDVVISRDEWYKDIKSCKSKISGLGFPLVIKPASLGSSIGVSVVDSESGLMNACELVLEMDDKILAEKYVKSVELNCSAMVKNNSIISSQVEMVFKQSEFLSFEDKYLKGQKSSKSDLAGMQSLARKVPAPISGALTQEIKFLTEGIYKCLECFGVIRVDYMLDNDEKLYVNEVNVIPGSLANYLWSEEFDFSALLDNLILNAIKRKVQKDSLINTIDVPGLSG